MRESRSVGLEEELVDEPHGSQPEGLVLLGFRGILELVLVLGLAALFPAAGPDLGEVGGVGASGVGNFEWNFSASLAADAPGPAEGSAVASAFYEGKSLLGVGLFVSGVNVH